MAIPELDPALRFMQLMWSVEHALHKVSKRMASVLGLTGPQRLAIRIIGRSPGMAAGQLAVLMHLDPSTVTGILRRLERAHLIRREADPADARRARLHLTAKARTIDRRTAGTIEAAVRRALASLPAHEVDAAGRVLSALADTLNNTSGAPVRRNGKER